MLGIRIIAAGGLQPTTAPKFSVLYAYDYKVLKQQDSGTPGSFQNIGIFDF